MRSGRLTMAVMAMVTVGASHVAAQATPARGAPAADIERLIDEGMRRSKVMEHIGHLTDRIGPRLPASPGMRRAREWATATFEGWGIPVRVESFGPFGRGWSLERFSVTLAAPYVRPLLGWPSAWSPPTNGAVTGEVVYLDLSDRGKALRDKDARAFDGRIVLLSEERPATPEFAPLARRFDDSRLLEFANHIPPSGDGARRTMPDTADPMIRTMLRQLGAQGVLIGAKPLAVVENSMRGSGGMVMVHSAPVIGADAATMRSANGAFGAWLPASAPFVFPSVTLAGDDYNHLVRLAKRGERPRLTLDIGARYHDDDPMGHNVIAEIPGSDPALRGEVVMLGAHLDSWHAGTGATDNGAGVAVVMEAMRLLKATGLAPRRTIRAALWDAEEQGLFGSRAYVERHFAVLAEPGRDSGVVPTRRPDHDRLSAYFNIDNGTGRVRGLYLMGNETVRPIFAEWLRPFAAHGASTLSLLSRAGSDHVSFDRVGLPGFGFMQDPIEYETRTHHTNLDVADRIVPDDLAQAATIMAAFVYNTAMMDERLPRKPAPASLPARPSRGRAR